MLDPITLEAACVALAQQPDSLPRLLRLELAGLGQDLAAHKPGAADRLHKLFCYHPDLRDLYEPTYLGLQGRGAATASDQSVSQAVGGALASDLDTVAAAILASANPAGAARRFMLSLQVQDAGLQARRTGGNAGRLAIAIGSGGALLGLLVAQIPGAIVGGLVAGCVAVVVRSVKGADRRASPRENRRS
jgi:hypothetical protein